MTEEEIKLKLGRKWRINLRNLYEIVVHYYKHSINKSIYISTHSRYLQKIIGTSNAMQASKVINIALNIGILKLDCNLFGFNHFYKENNYSRTFFIDSEVSTLITNSLHMGESIREERRGRGNSHKENKVIEVTNEVIINPSELPEISSKKKYDMTNKEVETILLAIKQRYPQIEYYQKILDEVNSYYTIDEYGRHDPHLFTYLQPKIHMYVDRNNKTLAKFGIRAYNELCSLPKHNDHVFDRTDELDYYMGKGNWFEYDLNASIYRIAKSIKDRSWYGDKIDIYEKFNGKLFENEDERKKFKIVCNIVNFSKDMNTACSAYRRQFKDERNLKNIELKPRLEEIKHRITEFCGIFDSEIFLHESCIVTGTVKLLLNKGLKAVQLYDCIFVSNNELTSNIDEYIRNSFNYYLPSFLSS